MKKETNPSKIVVQHLNLHYGENHALKDININIAQSSHCIYRSQWMRKVYIPEVLKSYE